MNPSPDASTDFTILRAKKISEVQILLTTAELFAVSAPASGAED